MTSQIRKVVRERHATAGHQEETNLGFKLGHTIKPHQSSCSSVPWIVWWLLHIRPQLSLLYTELHRYAGVTRDMTHLSHHCWWQCERTNPTSGPRLCHTDKDMMGRRSQNCHRTGKQASSLGNSQGKLVNPKNTWDGFWGHRACTFPTRNC